MPTALSRTRFIAFAHSSAVDTSLNTKVNSGDELDCPTKKPGSSGAPFSREMLCTVLTIHAMFCSLLRVVSPAAKLPGMAAIGQAARQPRAICHQSGSWRMRCQGAALPLTPMEPIHSIPDVGPWSARKSQIFATASRSVRSFPIEILMPPQRPTPHPIRRETLGLWRGGLSLSDSCGKCSPSFASTSYLRKHVMIVIFHSRMA
jgi:hypothetical protein